MLDGKKTYASAVVATASGTVVYFADCIRWQDLVSVCFVAAGFIMVRIAIAANAKLTKQNASLIREVLTAVKRASTK